MAVSTSRVRVSPIDQLFTRPIGGGFKKYHRIAESGLQNLLAICTAVSFLSRMLSPPTESLHSFLTYRRLLELLLWYYNGLFHLYEKLSTVKKGFEPLYDRLWHRLEQLRLKLLLLCADDTMDDTTLPVLDRTIQQDIPNTSLLELLIELYFKTMDQCPDSLGKQSSKQVWVQKHRKVI